MQPVIVEEKRKMLLVPQNQIDAKSTHAPRHATSHFPVENTNVKIIAIRGLVVVAKLLLKWLSVVHAVRQEFQRLARLPTCLKGPNALILFPHVEKSVFDFSHVETWKTSTVVSKSVTSGLSVHRASWFRREFVDVELSVLRFHAKN